MKIKSQVITQASGSIGGLTASRNKGGMYFRARAIPTNPNSPEQAVVRQIFGALANHWINTLDSTDRAVWDLYAANVPVVDSLGDQISLTGQQMYIRSNTPIVQAGLTRVDLGPFIFNLGDFTAPTFAATAASNEIAVAFDAGDPWSDEDNSAMLVYTGRPQNQSINYFKGPYRFAGAILGDGTTPPTSPATITAAFPFEVDQRVFVKIRVVRADGRVSAPFLDFSLAT